MASCHFGRHILGAQESASAWAQAIFISSLDGAGMNIGAPRNKSREKPTRYSH